MQFNLPSVRTLALSILLASATRVVAQSTAPAELESTTQTWLKIDDCLLDVENKVSVPVQEAGVLATIAVKINDVVDANQQLAELDSSDAEREFEQRQREYATAYDLARDELDIKYHENLLQAAALQLEKFEALGNSNSVNELEISQRKLTTEGARISLHRAEKAKDRATLDALRLQVAVKMAEARLHRTSVKASLAGVVTEIFQHPGEWVQVGQPLLTITDLKHLVVHAHVPVDQIDRARLIGAKVRIESTTDQGAAIRLAGIVTSYDPRVTSSGLLRIHAQVLNVMSDGHWQLLPGKPIVLHLAQPENSRSKFVQYPEKAGEASTQY